MIEDGNVPGEGRDSNPGTCETQTLRTVTGLLSGCQEHRLIGVVVGVPGSGKTTAAMEYAASHHDVVYCRMTRAAEKARAGMQQISAAISGGRDWTTSEFETYQSIERSLGGMVSPLLVLDESQNMADRLLECIRDLYDVCGIGLVLIGNPTLPNRWSRRGQHRRQSFDQLRGRIGPQIELPRPLAKDIDTIIESYGVDGAESRKLLAATARQRGGLHNLAAVLRIARRIQPEGPLTVDTVREAIGMSGGLDQ